MIKIAPARASPGVERGVITDISQWKTGQILNAMTEHGGDVSSKVLLRVGPYMLETRTPVSLQDGQALKLLVKIPIDNKEGNLPVLKIIAPSVQRSAVSESASQQLANTTTAAVKLRQFIAVQQSFSQLQQTSQTILRDTSLAEQLPQSLKSWLNKIQDNLLLTDKQVSASQLKQHIQNSGLFLESKLRDQVQQKVTHNTSQNILSSDLKYQLLATNTVLKKINTDLLVDKIPTSQPTVQQYERLINEVSISRNSPQHLTESLLTVLPKSSIVQLISLLSGQQPQTPVRDELLLLAQALTQVTQHQVRLFTEPQTLLEQLQYRLQLLELGHQVEQSIQKLTSMQLQPLSRESDNLLLLLFGLVFKDEHQQFDIDFRIQQQETTAEAEQESWQITLGFHFATLGNVQSKIQLKDDQVSTLFYTELPATAHRIQQLLPVLEKGLLAAGLQVKNLAIAKTPFEQKGDIDHGIHLLDETV